MLLYRNYNKNVIKAAVDKALLLDRNVVLEKVKKPQTKRVILTLRYHPKLTSVSKVVLKH